jgi:mycofactocin glycosyltransferase
VTGQPPGPSLPPLPAGFELELDQGARQLAADIWFGGSPPRFVRMTEAGQAALRELLAGPVVSRAAGLLARRLTDAGLAHPKPAAKPVAKLLATSAAGHAERLRESRLVPDVTVIVPAHDRADLLDGCLAALGRDHPVVVVDDGSRNPAAVAAVARRHGSRLIRRDVNGGPGAARNAALRSAVTDLVAFIDSDCVPPKGWIEQLAGHFADPLVAAVAPRITCTSGGRAGASPMQPSPPGSWCARYASASGALDLGCSAARVMPRASVSYVPSAALIARRTALRTAARDGMVFDESMRTGEDVDLVWRLHEVGWRIRYDPTVEVAHHEPATWRALLSRRFRYGRSAAPLALRHPGAVTHLVLHPWPAVAVAAALARRPGAAAAAFSGSLAATNLALRRAGVPRRGLFRAMLAAITQTWLGAGRYGTQFAAPLLAGAIAAPATSQTSRRWGRRAAATSLLLGPPLVAWAKSRRTLGPARFVLARIADDVAYGLGVWAGCAAERTTEPIRPAIAWRPISLGQLSAGQLSAGEASAGQTRQERQAS